MKCPACERHLTAKKVGELVVDVCEGGCGGIWFDNFELQKVDEKHETLGEELLDIPRDPSVEVDLKKKRKCPKCEDIVMMQHYFSVKEKVVLDECPGCGGIWLDAGELKEIRNLFENEEEKNKAFEEKFNQTFGAEIKRLEEEGRAKLERAEKMAGIFKYISPSYYKRKFLKDE